MISCPFLPEQIFVYAYNLLDPPAQRRAIDVENGCIIVGYHQPSEIRFRTERDCQAFRDIVTLEILRAVGHSLLVFGGENEWPFSRDHRILSLHL
jgi:hypothetical protein